jgi:hypothetical protein
LSHARFIRTACQVLNCSYAELKTYPTAAMQHVLVLIEADEI